MTYISFFKLQLVYFYLQLVFDTVALRVKVTLSLKLNEGLKESSLELRAADYQNKNSHGVQTKNDQGSAIHLARSEAMILMQFT